MAAAMLPSNKVWVVTFHLRTPNKTKDITVKKIEMINLLSAVVKRYGIKGTKPKIIKEEKVASPVRTGFSCSGVGISSSYLIIKSAQYIGLLA